ncbi:uncharacterized protein LOC133205751 [Saccostrea echinata]|uniref:uncharacterized protein LOC133205751 n=1 Tax=Saccostrea echinata TaxID=191078 RepID=UPI002A8075C6|nr:uncharacterized protein LOC133205751 [Saccostrea echinata]
MEYTDENKFSLTSIRKDGSECKHHRKSHRRSSSILKIPQSKLPLSDLDPNQQDGCKFPPAKKARRSENRRVSFADTCQIKEFPKDSPGAWHNENSSAENSPDLENTIEQEKPEISGLDKLLTGSIQHPGFTNTDEDVQEIPFEEDQPLGVPVDPINHTLITNDEMELTGLVGLSNEPPDDFEELKSKSRVDHKFLQSLISSEKRTKSTSLQIETPEKLFHAKAQEDPDTYVYTTMNRYSCSMQSTMSSLITGTTTLSSQLSVAKRAPLTLVPSSQKPELLNSGTAENMTADLASELDVLSNLEKPKATGFLQSLLKNQNKDKIENLRSAYSTSTEFERTQVFTSGDGMDETAVLDSTIWTVEKRDLHRLDTLQKSHDVVEKIHVESNSEVTQVFHGGDAMEETKLISGGIWMEEEIYKQGREKTQIFSTDGNMEETKVLKGEILTGSDRDVEVTVNSQAVEKHFQQGWEETKISVKDDNMEETKALTGGIWTGIERSVGITGGKSSLESQFKQGGEETRIFGKGDNMEETKALTGGIWTDLERSFGKTNRENSLVSGLRKGEETKIFGKEDSMEETKALLGEIWTGSESVGVIGSRNPVEKCFMQGGEESQIFGKDDNMEETKALTGGIFTDPEAIGGKAGKDDSIMNSFKQGGEETKKVAKEDNMEETKALTGGIWTAESQSIERTKTVNLMEETKALTGGIWTAESQSIERTKTVNLMEETKALTGVIEVESSTQVDRKGEVNRMGEQTEKSEKHVQDGDQKDVASLCKKEHESKMSEMEEADSDNDSEISFNFKKTETGNTTSLQADDVFEAKRTEFLVESTVTEKESERCGEEVISDKGDGNTRTLADLKNLLKEHTSKFDDILMNPVEGSTLIKENIIASKNENIETHGENKTLMFSNKSDWLEETKMVTANIEIGSTQNSISKNDILDWPRVAENKTVLFADKSAAMDETKPVTANLISDNEPLASVPGVGAENKIVSETVEKLPTLTGSNITLTFGNNSGAMEETKIKTSLSTVQNRLEGKDVSTVHELPQLAESIMADRKSNINLTGTQKTDDKQLSLMMEGNMVGLLEQAPPENLFTDATLNSTVTSFRPESTSTLASPIDSTQALLNKDCDNITMPPDNITAVEESLISQLSINKTAVECDITQDDIWTGPMTALSLCDYLQVVKPSCLKASKLYELRRTRCSLVQEEEIPCDDLKSKVLADLTVKSHIEAQMEMNAQMMAEVDKKKVEIEKLEEKWLTEPPEIFHYAQTCSPAQKVELREKMVAMSNVCTRLGKIEWKKASVQAAALELQKIQEGNRKLNLEVGEILQMATDAMQNIEVVNQELEEMDEEILEMKQTPVPSEQEIQEYLAEKAFIEKKQADLTNMKNEDISMAETNRRLSEEHAALAEKLSSDVRQESQKDNMQELQNQTQKIRNEIQLLYGMSGWYFEESSFRTGHKTFMFSRRKLRLEINHEEERISSIEMMACDKDVQCRREQFCLRLAEEAVNGVYLKQKYSKLNDLPQILHEVGTLVLQMNALHNDLMFLEMDHYIAYKYPRIHLEVWSPRKRCVSVSFHFQFVESSLIWSIEPSLDVEFGIVRNDAALSQIKQVEPGDSYLNRMCAAIDLDSLPEDTSNKCPVCGLHMLQC